MRAPCWHDRSQRTDLDLLEALVAASSYGHVEAVKLLLKHGAAEAYTRGVDRDAEELDAASAADSLSRDNDRIVHRVVDSPLHRAVARGHIRIVWLLLSAGFSAQDVDSAGNTPLHLAVGPTCPEGVQEEMARTLMMHAGVDLGLTNWLGLTVQDVARPSSPGVFRLLADAHRSTRCFSTGVPFSHSVLQYLCAVTGRWYCEDASVPMSVRAFANSGEQRPVRVGAEALYRVSEAEEALGIAMYPWGRYSGAAPGWGLQGGVAIDSSNECGGKQARGTAAVTVPGQCGDLDSASSSGDGFCSAVGAVPSPRVASGDANTAPASTTSSTTTTNIAADSASAAAAVKRGSSTNTSAFIVGAAIAEAEDEDEQGSSTGAPGSVDGAIGAGSLDGGSELGADHDEWATRSPTSRGSVRSGGERDVQILHGGGGGGFSDALQTQLSSNSDSAAAPIDTYTSLGPEPSWLPAAQPELFFDSEQCDALGSAAGVARDIHADPMLRVLSTATLHRLDACATLSDAIRGLASARPLLRRTQPELVTLLRALASAEAVGLAPSHWLHCMARAAADVAVAELSLTAAVDSARNIEAASHEHDCDIDTLSHAITEAGHLAAHVQQLEAQRDRWQAAMRARTSVAAAAARAVSEPSLDDGNASDAVGDAAAGGDGASFEVPIWRLALPVPRCSAEASTAGTALLATLRAECGVTDSIASAAAAADSVREVVTQTGTSNMLAYPCPSLSPEEDAAVQVVVAARAAAAAAAAAAAGGAAVGAPASKGKASTAPGKGPVKPVAPVPAGKGARSGSAGAGKASTAASLVMPRTSCPIDTLGRPLPQSPQLAALTSLATACDAVKAAADAAKLSGAGAASVRAAEESVAAFRALYDTALVAYVAAVEAARATAPRAKSAAAGGGKKKAAK